jgi:hypothetical protein
MLIDERNDFMERKDSHYNWDKVFKESPEYKFGIVPSLLKVFDFNVGDICDTQVLDYMVAHASLQTGTSYSAEELGENLRSEFQYPHIPIRKYKCDYFASQQKNVIPRIQ